MKKDSKVEFLREKNLSKIIEKIKKEGKYSVLSEFTPFYDRRTYFKMSAEGDIKVKDYNPLLILFAFSDDEEKLGNYLLKYSYLEEKQVLKKIDRASNLNVEVLKEKLMKTLYSSNLNFSKIFTKELFLKSKKDFFEVIYTFSLMSNPKNLKIFFCYSLEKIFEEYEYDDNLLFIVISYLTKIRDDYSNYLNVSSENTELKSDYLSIDKKIYLDIFNKITKKYNFKNINKFKNLLNFYFENDFNLNEDIKTIFLEKKI